MKNEDTVPGTEPQQTPARTLADEVLSALGTLKVAPAKSVWTGPFDQLVSSGYALVTADRLGFVERKVDGYYETVLQSIVDRLSAELKQKEFPLAKLNDSDEVRNYLSSFYFNAGFQRFTWGAERLATTFAAVTCTCEKNEPGLSKKDDGRWPGLKCVVAATKDRIRHLNFAADSRFRSLVQQLEDSTEKHDPNAAPDASDEKKALYIFRDQVNPKKHSVFDFKFVQDSRPLKEGRPWSSRDQMELAVHAYELVCNAYCELLLWNPDAKLP